MLIKNLMRSFPSIYNPLKEDEIKRRHEMKVKGGEKTKKKLKKKWKRVDGNIFDIEIEKTSNRNQQIRDHFSQKKYLFPR